MLKLASIKKILIKLFGPRFTGVVHGSRFAYLIWRKSKTDPEMLYLASLIREGDVCVDVGSNSADWTTYFSRKVGKKGAVFSFEADPYYAHATHTACRILRLSNVVFFDFGLSDKSEVVNLVVSDESGTLLSGTQKIISANSRKKDLAVTVSIALRRLDSLTVDYPTLNDANFIKIDVEGYELFVLRGAEGIIKRKRPVIVLEYGEYADHGYTAADLNAYLEGCGYVGFGITHGRDLVRVDRNMECLHAISSNRIYVPLEKTEQVCRAGNSL
jgi:FkbM family methyltransferase